MEEDWPRSHLPTPTYTLGLSLAMIHLKRLWRGKALVLTRKTHAKSGFPQEEPGFFVIGRR